MVDKLVARINNSIQPAVLLSAYWVLFWALNGMDKFFNGTMEPMIEAGLEKGVVVNAGGQVVNKIYGYEINGLFGVNRNAKTVTFFERLGIPEDAALGLLYGVAVAEIIIAAIFVAGLILWFSKKRVHATYTVLAYKLSIVLFMTFCIMDILIGERIELWEHNTFLIILLLSYFGFMFRTQLFGIKKIKPQPSSPPTSPK